MDIVEDIESDRIVLFLESRDLERRSLVYIRTASLCVLHIARTVVGCHALVHDSVAVSRTWLETLHNNLVDLSDREHAVSSGIVILVSLLVVEM